jgi:hypothetical protein
MPGPSDSSDPRRRQGAIRRAPAGGDVVPGRPRRPEPAERDDDPSEADVERFGGVTRRCPECGKEVYDDAAVCYHCGHAFAGTGAPGSKGMPVWAIVTVVLIIGGFVLASLWHIF